MAIFATIVDRGSFREAAKALKLTPSVVSHHLAKLEQQLGVALLYRSTRKLALTHDGETLYISAKKMLSAAEFGVDQIAREHTQLIGSLKIAMPAVYSKNPILAKLAKFSIDHPRVDFDIKFDDLPLNLIDEGIDLAIRAGDFPDSVLMSKKLHSLSLKLLVSPKYIENNQLKITDLRHPNDLATWDFIGISQRPFNKLFLGGNGKKGENDEYSKVFKLDYKPRITVDDIAAAQHFAEQGLGIVSPPEFLYADPVAKGELVEILPHWKLREVPVHLVWPPNAPKDSLTKRLVDFLTE